MAEEFALSSFPGFIFRAPSAKLPGISFVPFSSDNAALAACAKGWLTRKLAFSPPGESGGAGRGEGRGDSPTKSTTSFLLFVHRSYASPPELSNTKNYMYPYNYTCMYVLMYICIVYIRDSTATIRGGIVRNFLDVYSCTREIA